MDLTDADLEEFGGQSEELAALVEEKETLIQAIIRWQSSERPEASDRVMEFEGLLVEIEAEISRSLQALIEQGTNEVKRGVRR